MAVSRFKQFYYTTHRKPVQLDCSFTVAPSDSAGLGITGLVGGGFANVFMHTTATPAAGNPNPAAGYIYVKLNDNYSGYYFGTAECMSPNSGTNIAVTAGGAALTAGQVYVISVLGTSTAADWAAIGVPVGTTAAVGVSFVAIATGAGTGTGQVQVPLASGSGLQSIEPVGVPALQMASKLGHVAGQASGSYLILQCLAATNSTTTTLVAKAPAAGSKMYLKFILRGN